VKTDDTDQTKMAARKKICVHSKNGSFVVTQHYDVFYWSTVEQISIIFVYITHIHSKNYKIINLVKKYITLLVNLVNLIIIL